MITKPFPNFTKSIHRIDVMSRNLLILLILLAIFSPDDKFIRTAEGGKRRVHITDDLHDVVDDEEDDGWKQWGKKSSSSADKLDPQPEDLSKSDIADIQKLMSKQQPVGPVFGFVKLRMGKHRKLEMVGQIAMKWSKVMKTGGVEVNFLGLDSGTIMFTMQQGRDMNELKEFILNDEEAYEIKIGDQVFRRPGDPSYEQLLDEIVKEKEKQKNKSTKNDEGLKEEL